MNAPSPTFRCIAIRSLRLLFPWRVSRAVQQACNDLAAEGRNVEVFNTPGGFLVVGHLVEEASEVPFTTMIVGRPPEPGPPSPPQSHFVPRYSDSPRAAMHILHSVRAGMSEKDREEALKGALTAVYSNVPVRHLKDLADDLLKIADQHEQGHLSSKDCYVPQSLRLASKMVMSKAISQLQ